MKSLPPTQACIYEAVVRLFAQRGTTHTNVSELAQAAGLARGTIYNSLRSKPLSKFVRVWYPSLAVAWS